jgi:hypothetical protein
MGHPLLSASVRYLVLAMVGMYGLAASAAGPWVPVSTRADGDALFAQAITSSAPPALSHNSAAVMQVMSLLNYSKTQWWGADKRYQSTVAQWEIQCAQGTYRTVSFTGYAGSMGSGEVVMSDRQTSLWSPVSPQSIPGDLLRWACKS